MEEAFVMKSSNERRDSTTKLTVEDEEIIEPSNSGRNQFYKMHRTLALIDKSMTGVGLKIIKQVKQMFTFRCWP